MSETFSKSSSFHHQGLPDDLLIDILCRLPCENVFLLKCISKHWHSLISDPKFIICLIQHKIRTNPKKPTTAAAATKKWTLIHTKETNSIKEVTFRSSLDLPLISDFTGLDFLPFPHVTIAAAFKDLILCYNINQSNRQREYHIANPVTKQWLSLPPSPLLPFERDRSWDALICEEPYHYNEHQRSITGINLGYRFRVVLIHPFPEVEDGAKYDPFGNFNLVVFCSETWQWKQVILVIPTHDMDEHICFFQKKGGFDGVVCKRILYLRHNLTFGAFDPFNVTDSSNNALLATSSLPLPFSDLGGSMYEVEGKVLFFSPVASFPALKFVIHVLKSRKKKKRYPVRWKRYGIYELECETRKLWFRYRVIGYDILDKRFGYLILKLWNEGILYDMRSPDDPKSISLCLPGHHISAFTFEPQYCPTPIPERK